MVFNGRIYETNGAEAVGVHAPDEVRPLLPVPRPGSLRFFPNRHLEPDEEPAFFYGNPACLVGASTVVNVPERIANLSFEVYFGAVLVVGGYDVAIEEADDMVLGVSIVIALVDRTAARVDGFYGRSHDLGIALGPVLTPPDEPEEFRASQALGRSYRLDTVARVNSVDRARGNVEALPFTIAQAIASASRSCTLREGDIVVLGPICEIPEDLRLEGGDEITVAVENLGALSLKLSIEA